MSDETFFREHTSRFPFNPPPDNIPRPWTMKRCECGHPACTSWKMSFTQSEGNVTEADGRLACAAPMMLSTLQCVVVALEHTRRSPADIVEIVRLARDAIAKATGKSYE